MPKSTINHQSLTHELLPEIVIKRTFQNLPEELQKLYQEKIIDGQRVAVGLDIRLGFYLIQYSNQGQVELVWSENKRRIT